MKHCSRCILPENYPGISFNENGVCNYCSTYTMKKNHDLADLERLISTIKKKKNIYDCLVGISGGRDSAYTLYWLVKKHRLKVLAYSADNGFIPEVAKSSMRNMTEILGVDLVIERHNLMKSCVKSNFTAWMASPAPAMIPMMCCGCRLGMFRGILRQAKKYKIPIIALGSGNTVEISHFKKAFLSNNPFGRIARRNVRISILLGLFYEILKNPRYFLDPDSVRVYVLEYLYFFFYNLIQKVFYPRQKTLLLFDYVEWDEDEIMHTIKRKLKWKAYGDGASAWRSDCAISFLKNYALRKTVGFDEKDELLCNMIREGMVCREEAAKRLKAARSANDGVVFSTLKEIDVEMIDFQECLAKCRIQYSNVHENN